MFCPFPISPCIVAAADYMFGPYPFSPYVSSDSQTKLLPSVSHSSFVSVYLFYIALVLNWIYMNHFPQEVKQQTNNQSILSTYSDSVSVFYVIYRNYLVILQSQLHQLTFANKIIFTLNKIWLFLKAIQHGRSYKM